MNSEVNKFSDKENQSCSLLLYKSVPDVITENFTNEKKNEVVVVIICKIKSKRYF